MFQAPHLWGPALEGQVSQRVCKSMRLTVGLSEAQTTLKKCTRTLTPSTRQRKQVERTRAFARFSVTGPVQAQAKLGTHHGSSCSAEQLPTKAKATAAEVSAPLSGTEWARAWQGSGQSGITPAHAVAPLAPQHSFPREQRLLLLETALPWRTAPAWTQHCTRTGRAWPLPAPAAAVLPYGAEVPVLGGGRTHRGSRASSDLTLGASDVATS